MPDPIRVAVVGVGNCCSSLVQGVHYYRDRPELPGLIHERVGPYGPEDIQFSAAFDVNVTKVGADLSDAIFAEPNNTLRFWEVPYLDVTVLGGKLLDGIGRVMGERVRTVEGPSSVAEHLKATRTDVLVNYLPVGSQEATEFYAAAALEAGCAFVNSIPVFIARDEKWRGYFREAGLPLIGDDIKSQVGATIVHRVLADLFSKRGVRLERTSQLNFGGNADFMNMLEEERLVTKRQSKSSAVTDVANGGEGLAPENVHIGPSDYVPWLGDRKWAHIRLEGSAFGGAPLTVELKLEVWDSPNSAGVVIDAVRFAQLARDQGEGGPLDDVCAWLMKAPGGQKLTDDAARERLEAVLARYRLGLMPSERTG